MRHLVMVICMFGLAGGCTSYQTVSWGGSVGWEEARHQSRQADRDLLAAVDRAFENGAVAGGAPVSASFDRQALDLPSTGRVVVMPGDTLSQIAGRYGIGLPVLAKINNLVRPYPIFVGQEIWLKPVPAMPERYQVVDGDTFLGIAYRYGLRYDTLRRRNPDVNPERLLIGQILNIGREPPDLPQAPIMVAKLEQASQAPTPDRSVEGFQWPLEGSIVQRFGDLPNGTRSDGINIAAAQGSTVRAAESGVVEYAGEAVTGMGRMLMIRHGDDFRTAYGHNEALLVTIGDRVSKGQPIARAGNTGSVTQAQLHFQIRKGTVAVDPLPLLRDETRFASRN